jgi:RLL motif-containing protein 1
MDISSSAPPIPAWKLALLGYPRAAELSLAAPAEVATLAAFLEDRHVRALPEEQREPLRRAGAAFAPALDAYLRRLACPLAPAAPLGDRLAWLAQHALALAFEDGAAGFNAASAAEELEGAPAAAEPAAAAAAATAAAATAAAAAASAPEKLPADAHALVLELARLLRVPTEARDDAHVLQGCHRVLRMRVLPAVAELEATSALEGPEDGGAGAAAARRRPAARAAASADAGADAMRDFGAGFSTGDATLDRACAVLRMLYVADLRELQDAVNDILVEIQSFTADPKTDSALGVVGR